MGGAHIWSLTQSGHALQYSEMDSLESSVSSSGEKGSSAENKVFSAAKEEEAVEELVPPSPSSQDAILARHQ